MFALAKICVILVLCALGCDSVATDGEATRVGRADVDPFLAHTGTCDVVTENSDVAGATVVGVRDNDKVIRFVEYLSSNGIQLRYDEAAMHWQVVSPTFGDYVVRIESIAAFPDSSTLVEMQIGCLAMNLLHGLNPRAQLIMSLPGLVRASDDPNSSVTVEESQKQGDTIRSSAQYVALENELKTLFIEYQP